MLRESPGGAPRRVLVTGASGVVGGELCRALAARGHAVLALLHRSPTLRGAGGDALPARPWCGREPPAPGRIATLRGDLLAPLLGLDPAALSGRVDVLVHAAAATGFAQDPALHRAVNLGGTERALALAEAAELAFLHVGTAYACGEASGAVEEAPFPPGARFANSYEESKAAAERLVLAAIREGRVRAAVARPSIVVGTHARGAIARFDGPYALFRLAGEGRVRTLPAEPHATLDLVPLCHVAEGLADLAERMAAAEGRIFHLCSGAPVPLASLCALALFYRGLRAPRLVRPEHFDPDLLPPEERWWHGQVGRLFGPYLRRDPRFRLGALRSLSGRDCPPVDTPFLRRLVDFALAAGFLREGGGGPAAAPQRMSG